jgi:hypothetical protein
MRGRLGGWLIIGGGALVAIAIAKYLNGDGLGDVNGLLIDGALALFGAGAIVLCAVGPEPLNGRLVRAGLGVLGVGQLGLLAFSVLAAASPPELLLGQPPIILDGVRLGLQAAALGLLLTGLALAITPGRARAVGALLLAGVLLGAATAVAYETLRIAAPAHTALWALVLVIAGNVGVGLLAITSEGASAVAQDDRRGSNGGDARP